jgi:lysyl-tRNA synthetase class 2
MKNWQKFASDPELQRKLLMREQVIDAIRAFFKQRSYHEVETPLLVACPGAEPYLNLFETSLGTLQGERKRAFLLTSPEYAMKKLVVAGVGSIFQICKSFRNVESLGGTHNPEFTILEWYQVGADYQQLMAEFEQLLLAICSMTGRDAKCFVYQGREYDLSQPYLRFSVAELFERYVDLSADQLLDLEALRQAATVRGYDLAGLIDLNPDMAWEELYHQLFLNEIESRLAEFDRPVIVYDYPAPQAALARKKASDPRFAERFEVYLGGLELGNAFGELTDAVEQEARLRTDLQLRQELGKSEQPLDQDFIDALHQGMPETSGIAVGVDRLVMLIADAADIDEVLFFPASEIFHESV